MNQGEKEVEQRNQLRHLHKILKAVLRARTEKEYVGGQMWSPRFNLQQGTFQPGEPLPAAPAQECDAITGLARGKGL